MNQEFINQEWVNKIDEYNIKNGECYFDIEGDIILNPNVMVGFILAKENKGDTSLNSETVNFLDGISNSKRLSMIDVLHSFNDSFHVDKISFEEKYKLFSHYFVELISLTKYAKERFIKSFL